MASTLLTGATLLHLDPPAVEVADVRIDGGDITAVAPGLPHTDADTVHDLGGLWLMPGLVCAHTHLYSSLATGMPLLPGVSSGFADMLARVWWRLDRALDRDGVAVAGLVGAITALRAGVTTLIDHHASPSFIEGSLEVLDGAIDQVGLRRVLCYEVTDRGGPAGAAAGLRAHEGLLAAEGGGRRAVMIGAHASFTLSDVTLARVGAMAREAGVGVHIHVAESAEDEALSGEEVVGRLDRLGALVPGSVLAHCVHLAPSALARAADAGAWISHQPRSNMNNGVGRAPLASFPDTTALGTDGIGADLFAEAQTGFFRGNDHGGSAWTPDRWLAAMAGGARLAGPKLGLPLGRIAPGAAADLVVCDPQPGPPLTAGNVAAATIFRLGAGMVRSVMIGGDWRLWDRQPLSVDPHWLDRRARSAAETLWAAMATVPFPWSPG